MGEFQEWNVSFSRPVRDVVSWWRAKCRGVTPSPNLRVGFLLSAGFALFPFAAPSSASDLFVYCCAGFRPPLEAAAAEFEARHEVEIEMTFAGSGCLIAQAELAGRGDIFLPGESHYIFKADARGLVQDITPIAYLRPVIGVRKGNPRDIGGLEDLAKEGIRVGLGDPRSVAVGVASERWFADALDDATTAKISQNVITRAINVNELGNQLALGGIDAAIVWDVTTPLFTGLEAVVPESSVRHRTVITGGVLEMSKNKELSAAFLSFLRSDEGQAILKKHGYEPYEGTAEDFALLAETEKTAGKSCDASEPAGSCQGERPGSIGSSP